MCSAAVCRTQRWMKNAGARKDFELASVKMRAMEMILSRPGVDVAKARDTAHCTAGRRAHLLRLRVLHLTLAPITQLSLLVAGPDWLTGVLAGMLGTNVWHVLAAQTAPTALLIAGPATAAGAFLLRVGENKCFLSLCSLLLFFAAGVQACMLDAPVLNTCRAAALTWHHTAARRAWASSCFTTASPAPPRRTRRS